MIQFETHRKKRMKENKNKFRDMRGTIKCTNIRVNGKENIFLNNGKTLLNSMVNTNLYIQEVYVECIDVHVYICTLNNFHRIN